MTDATLFICVIENTDHLDEILEAIVECGGNRGALTDVRGVLEYLSTEIPLFSGFKTLLDDPHPTHKLVLSVMENDAKVREVMDVIEEITGEFSRSQTGFMFALNIHSLRGVTF